MMRNRVDGGSKQCGGVREPRGSSARWMEKIGEFDFEVKYLPGVENILPDALSCMYAFDAPGTV